MIQKVVYVGIHQVHVSLRRMYTILLLLDEAVYGCHYTQWIDCSFEFSYVLTDFLPAESVLFI